MPCTNTPHRSGYRRPGRLRPGASRPGPFDIGQIAGSSAVSRNSFSIVPISSATAASLKIKTAGRPDRPRRHCPEFGNVLRRDTECLASACAATTPSGAARHRPWFDCARHSSTLASTTTPRGCAAGRRSLVAVVIDHRIADRETAPESAPVGVRQRLLPPLYCSSQSQAISTTLGNAARRRSRPRVSSAFVIGES
jgi:hypothetical protein